MSRIYTVPFRNKTIATADGDVDFWEITPAANKPVKLVGMFIGNSSASGDTNEKQIDFTIYRVPVTATSGSGGAAVTPRKVDPHDAAAGFTAEVVNTTVATTSGTLDDLHSDTFNIRAGVPIMWPDALQLICTADIGILVVRNNAALSASVTFNGTLYVQEGL